MKNPARDSAPNASETPSIIGIGASAGGLEALEVFFAHTTFPSESGFVVIQHLDPSRKGLMPELLQRATPMKVIEAKHHTKVEANCVYVIPPGKDLSILHGSLVLLDPVEPRGLRLPIDFFFHALADDQGPRAVAVVLSGMGADGSIGLRAIKEKSGLGVAQTPESAKFDAMPCRAAPLMRALSTSSPLSKNCPAASAPIWRAHHAAAAQIRPPSSS